MDPARAVEDVLAVVSGTTIAELEVQWEGGRVRVVRDPSWTRPNVAPPPSAEGAAGDRRVTVTSSYVGVLHREEGMFPAVGDHVAAGAALAEVETLQMRNPVSSPIEGMLAEVLARDRTAVEYGQPLFLVDPLDEEPLAESAAPGRRPAGRRSPPDQPRPEEPLAVNASLPVVDG